MAFDLPNLDTATSKSLQDELIRRIPLFTTLWTDYNDSDPGITLLQLLCWIGESLLYQANAIPLETQRNFLRWVLGLAFSNTKTPYGDTAAPTFDYDFLALRQGLAALELGDAQTLADLQRAVLDYTASPYLAITLADIEALALRTNEMIDARTAMQNPGTQPFLVGRADAQEDGDGSTVYILSNRTYTYQSPEFANPKNASADGVLRRLLLLKAPADVGAVAAAERTLLTDVRNFLAPRILLGNRVAVASARLTDINLAVDVRCPPNIRPELVLGAMSGALFSYFLPGAQWRYGVAPETEDIQHVITEIPGVAAIERFVLSYAPTARMPELAELSANALIADLPPGPPGLLYDGLPRLRCLDLRAWSAVS